MGAGTVRDLLSPLSRDVTKVTVADNSHDRLNSLAESVEDARLVTTDLDVSNRQATIDLIGSADICINAVPTFAGLQMEIFECCLAARRPYVDYGGMGVYTVKQKQQHNQWSQAGLTAVLGLGADPGMSNVICKAVADRLDTIDAINLYWAAKLLGDENPVLVPPYSIPTVLAEYANRNQQFLDGRLQEVDPLSAPEILDLPPPFGPTEFAFTQHSEPLTIPFAAGIAEKGIREMTWKLSLPKAEHDAWVGLIKAGFGEYDAPLEFNGTKVTPRAFLEKLISRNIERKKDRIPQQQAYEIHVAIGRGTVAGNAAEVRCTVFCDPDPLYADYLDAATSMNVSIGAQLIMRNEMKNGVWGPEEYFDLEQYFAELHKRKFRTEFSTTITRGDGPRPGIPVHLGGRT